MCEGVLFQLHGPQTEKARLPNCRNSQVVEKCSCRHPSDNSSDNVADIMPHCIDEEWRALQIRPIEKRGVGW